MTLAALAAEASLVRCAVYTRQSVHRRGDDPALASCAVQRTLCTDFIRSMAGNGWYPITEPFDDEGFSGATVQRPALERLFARLQDGDIHRLVVYRLDRFTRSVSDWAHLAQRLERFDVGLTVVRGAIDAGAGALHNLQLNVLASFAELERSMIHERLSDARAAHRARGERFAGRVPLEYAPDPRTKQLVVVEAEAATVRELFTEAATGEPASTLCANANALGLPGKNGKRGHWDARALLRLLQNPVYAGRRPDGSPGVHAPIIDDESFDKVQAIISSRRTRSPSKRTTVDPRIDPFILRGLLSCEACGKTMTTSMSTALTKKSAVHAPRYYRCRTPGCAGGQVAAAEVEAMAHSALRRPRPAWPVDVRERMELLGSVWSDLWLGNRRLALASVFESMGWRARTRRLLLRPVATVEVQDEEDGVFDGS